MNESGASSDTRFPSSHSSMIFLAREFATVEGRRALGELLVRYRPALHSYILKKFQGDQNQADDLFQAFVEQVVLERELIGTFENQGDTNFAVFCSARCTISRSPNTARGAPANAFRKGG